MSNIADTFTLDPTERAFFIERTGVIMRWILIVTCSLIQFISPVIPYSVYWPVVALSLLYNGALFWLIHKRRDCIIPISYFSGLADSIISVVLIYFAGLKDVYLWYFVLLVSHAARYGFVGSLVSPLAFSIVYIGGLLIRGLRLPWDTLAIRSTFFIITGVVSGYLAREEHRRFNNILKQQQEIFIAQTKRKELRDMLQRYVSYNVVDELISRTGELKLGGARKKVSVLFSDIQGFTGLLSQVEPEAIIVQLNEYLGEMTNIIFQYNGMVDKFVGDAMIGIFGAIKESPDDARRAVLCALSMQKKLQELQERWQKTYAMVFQVRIAISTGSVIMGNVGSPRRMDFTAIGDPVNTASRLQAVARPGAVVISSDTYGEVQDLVEVEPLGGCKLKGKTHPLEVFEVKGVKNA